MKVSRLRKSVVSFLALWIALLTVCLGGVILACCIPANWIAKNTYTSAATLLKEDNLYTLPWSHPITRLTGFTDAWMINISYSVNDASPVQSAMAASYYEDKEGMNPVADIWKLVCGENKKLQKNDYSYYWHGYLTFLRPLQTILDYKQIRVLNYILLSCLLIYVLILLYAKSRIYPILFILSLAMVDAGSVPMTIFLSIDFYIAFVGAIFVHYFVLSGKSSYLAYLYFSIGAFTAYFDLLSTPIITLCIPFIMQGVYEVGTNKTSKLFKSAFVWGLGYFLLWSAKWVVGSIILDYNIIDHAISQISYRMSGDLWNGKGTRLYVLGKIWDYRKWIFLSLVLFCPLYYWVCSGMDKIKEWGWLVVMTLFPLAWATLAFQHTLLHFHFTVRILCVCVFSFLLFIYQTTGFKGNGLKIMRFVS